MLGLAVTSIVLAWDILAVQVPAIEESSGSDIRGLMLLLGLAVAAAGLGIRLQSRPRNTQEYAGGVFSTVPYGRIIHLAIPLVLALGAILWMLLIYRVDEINVFPDTRSYARVADKSLLSTAFWAGERPFVIPLAFKLVGINVSAAEGQSYLGQAGLLTQVQAVISLLAFAFLGLALASRIDRAWLRLVAIALIMAFGLSIDISMWNKILLSESLSTSFFAILIGLGLISSRYWKSPGSIRRREWVTLLAGISLISALFSFSRDSNSLTIVLVGLLLLLMLFVRRRQSKRVDWVFASVAIAMILIWGVQYYTIGVGRRWLGPFNNVLYERILTDPDAFSFFQARGFPKYAIESLSFNDRRDFQRYLATEPSARLISDWEIRSGRQVLVRYLGSDPLAAIVDPLKDIVHILTPDSTEYRESVNPEPRWFEFVRQVLYPSSLAMLAIWTAFVVAASFLLARGGSLRASWGVPLILGITAVPTAVFVWHSDTIELERHAFTISMQLRLALWIMTLLIADSTVERIARKHNEQKS